ncbi:hypothetical protein C8R47DRAFT_1065758 [Mycena vitilis]|nr:hypothetical protein C8R47DRAFT_1065758 [Mycena vitilis]
MGQAEDGSRIPATFSGISSLALELIHQIIDSVASQRVRRNLAACSLVCRRWTHHSRWLLFRDCRLLINCKNSSAFAELLRSPCCTILPHVRHLTLVNNGVRFRAFDDIKEELGLLANIESLKLSGSSWAIHGAAPSRGFMSNLTSVVELELDCPKLGDTDHALMIMCAFPSLRRLSVRQFWIGQRQESWHQSLLPPYPPYIPPSWIQPPLRIPMLTSLSITDSEMLIPLLHWLNSATSHHVTQLELSLPLYQHSAGFIPDSIPPLIRYLRNLSDSLEDLRLVFGSFPLRLDRKMVLEAFDLRNLGKLCSLHIEIRDPDLHRWNLVTLILVVHTLKSPFLERVCISFATYANIYGLPWTELDKFLSASEFPNLKAVRLSRTMIPRSLESNIRKWFTRTNSRGLLELHDGRYNRVF